MQPTSPVLFFAAASLLCAAEVPPRAGGGPPGGNVTAIVIDPRSPATIYAQTSAFGGLFKSTNGGGDWTELSFPTDAWLPGRLALDPVNTSTLYATSAGVLKSTDGGATWTTAGAIEGPVSMLAIDPVETSVLYAGTFAARGIFKSRDGGASWTAVNGGLSTYTAGPDQSRNAGDVTALQIDPSNRAVVYAAFNRGGVYVSLDAGANWRARNTGLPNTIVSALALHPSDPSTLYAAVYCGGGPVAPGFRCDGGIFKTTDGGLSWTNVSAGLQSQDVVKLVFAPSDASILYATTSGGWIYRAGENGMSWTPVHNGSYPGLSATGVPAFAVDPTNGSVLYVGTLGGGVYKSTDGGLKWSAANSGLTRAPVAALIRDPARAGALYAATSGAGVFRSEDGGASWEARSSGLTNTFVTVLTSHPVITSRLYAATADGSIFRSTDGGTSWVAASLGIPGAQGAINTLATDSVDPSIVFAGIGPYGGESRGGVFKSTDGGNTWTAVRLPRRPGEIDPAFRDYVFKLVTLPGRSPTLYAVTSTQLLKSTDAGENWTVISTESPVFDLAADPVNPDILYAPGGEDCWCEDFKNDLYKSMDGGVNWSKVGSAALGYIVVDPSDPSVLYTFGLGVKKSTDGGATWKKAGFRNTIVSALVFDRSNPSTMVAATARGLFKSTDGGSTWIPTGSK